MLVPVKTVGHQPLLKLFPPAGLEILPSLPITV